MTITRHGLRRIRVYEEPNASFAVDHSGTAGDFIDVPFTMDSGTWEPTQTLLDPMTSQQYMHGRPLQVIGPRSSKLSFRVPLFLTGRLGTSAQNTLTRASSAGLLLLDMFFGGSANTATGGSAISATSAAGVLTVSDGGGFQSGGACGWVNSSGLMEIREIQTVTGGTITLKHNLSAAPAVSDVIYNAITFYPSDKSTRTSLQFLVQGEEADDLWVIMGCMPSSASFELQHAPDAAIAMVSYEFQCADWAYVGSGSLTAATYSNFNPLAYNAGETLVQVVATATRSIVQHHSISLDNSITYVPAKSPNGTNGIFQYVHQHAGPDSVAKVTLGTYYEAQTWYTARSARTQYHVAPQIGRTSSGGALFTLPTAQVTNVTAPDDADGLVGSDVTFEAMLDTDTSGQSTELLRSAFRLHIVG